MHIVITFYLFILAAFDIVIHACVYNIVSYGTMIILLHHIGYRTGEKMRKGESRLFYDLSEVCVCVCVCVCVVCAGIHTGGRGET